MMPESTRLEHCETLIVGAGITGLTLARELLTRGARRIVILEKEPAAGAHASGRNSGVLHAGVYYNPGTLKARFCLEGNRLLKEYCRRKGLTLHECGKVIVTKDEAEISGLMQLKKRADSTGAEVSLIDDAQLARIEPYAATFRVGLFSPNTAIVRPTEILAALQSDLIESGQVSLRFGEGFEALVEERVVRTNLGRLRFERLVNAAGAHADRIARAFGLGQDYRILPFKGTYLKLRPERSDLVRGNIYPVPDLRNPFLGVHFTRGANGTVSIGPTAIPALGREHYGVIAGIELEALEILGLEALLFASNPAFRSAALSEPAKLFRRTVYRQAKRMLPSLELNDLEHSDKVGIRAQLVHWPARTLATDFVLVRDERSLHILNAISPAFTSSMAFARHLADQLESEQGERPHAVPVRTT